MDAPIISKDAVQTPKDTATTLQDSLNDLESLLYSEQAPQSESRWTFLDLHDERVPAIFKHAESYLNHILQLKQEWRSERLELPGRWAQQKPRIFMGDRLLAPYNISLMTAPIRSIIDRLSDDDISERHKSFSHKPDFCLAHFRHASRILFDYNSDKPVLSYELPLTTAPCFSACADLMLYDGTESNAQYSMMGMFCGIPGCLVTRSPRVHLPLSLLSSHVPRHEVDFAVLSYPIGSLSVRTLMRDKQMSITATHPALFLAMKGAAPWTNSASQRAGGTDLVFRDLASHVQPSLAILENTWHFQHGNRDVRAPPPGYGIIFGLTYDSQEVHLLAHFLLPQASPSSPREYVSLLVDTFEFLPVREHKASFSSWSETRTRLILALLTVQRHVFRLGALWDDVRFPSEVLRASEALDDAVMGSVDMAPQCGSTPSQVSGLSRYYFEEYVSDDAIYENENDVNLLENAVKPLHPMFVQYIESWRDAVITEETDGLTDYRL